MEGFDPTGLPYMANPLALDGYNNGPAVDYLNMLPTTGMQEQSGLYDTADFGM